MRFLASAALLSTGLLASASASADNGPAPVDATPPAAPIAATALPPAAPAPAAPLAPAYPTSLSYGPGYPAPYMMYPPPGAGAPPPYWMPVAGPTQRRSDSMRTTGIVLFAAGGLATAVGGVIFSAVATTGCPEVFVSDGGGPTPPVSAHVTLREQVGTAHQALNGCDTSPMLGLGILTAGVLTAVAGIPLFVIGSKRVPARTTTGKLAPELTVGAANATLRWTF
jgi:hypothetical protein